MTEFQKVFTCRLTGNSLRVIARTDNSRHYVAIYADVRTMNSYSVTSKLAHGMFTADTINACDYDLAKFLTEGSLKASMKCLGFGAEDPSTQEVLDYIKNPH